MARITVEDCLANVENRFQLVLAATKRARQISRGSEPLVEGDRDKPTVIALREIADGLVTMDILTERPEQPEISQSFMDMTDDGTREPKSSEIEPEQVPPPAQDANAGSNEQQA